MQDSQSVTARLMHQIFDGAERALGDLAGVFEYDGETAYFYLYATAAETGQRVLDSIRIFSGDPDLAEADISIRWDSEEQKVGLFIKGVLWALFDHKRRAKYGGSYQMGGKPLLPSGAEDGFD